MSSANTLVHEFTISRNQPDQKIEKSDNRKLNRGTGRGANYRSIHQINFTSVAKLGLGLRQTRMANESVGSYTGDKLTQRKVEQALTVSQYGVGLAVAGPIGVAYAAGDIAYRSLNYSIKVSRENQISTFIKNLSGNNARNNSRSSGEKI